MNRNAIVIGMLLIACTSFEGAQRQSLTARCDNSGVLFSFSGTLFRIGQDAKPAEVARGFSSPHDISWAPGCSSYAFVDYGSLWIGNSERLPRKVDLQGKVKRYTWSPNGKKLAVTQGEKLCDSEGRKGLGDGSTSDVLLVRVADLSFQRVTNDCGSFALGWSDDGDNLLIKRKTIMKSLVTHPTLLARRAISSLGRKDRSQSKFLLHAMS